MLNLGKIEEEKDLYLLLSWIIDSCDDEVFKSVSRFGLEEYISSLTNT